MSESWPTSAFEPELAALRARAYGPDPDILLDPAAVARLAELESLHAAKRAALREDEQPGDDESESASPRSRSGDAEAAPTQVAGSAVEGDPAHDAPVGERAPVSLWRRATATRSGRFWLAGGSVLVALAVVYAVSWVIGPHPEATLRVASDKADAQVLSLAAFARLAEIDESTLRGYEPHRGLEPWVAENRQGSRCMLIVERASDNLQDVNCAPPGEPVIAYVGAWPFWGDPFAEGLPDGSVFRFTLRGDVVDVDFYPAADAG